MAKLDLEAQERKDIGKKSKTLRRSGLIPAVIYGRGVEPKTVSVAEGMFLKTITTSAGSNVIINLKIGSDSMPVIAHELQRDPLSDKIIHVDFLHIKMDEAIKTKVHIELKGTPIGVKDDGGILVHALREVEIKCLPTNIPEKIEVDVSALKIGDGIQVSDIKGLKDIEILTSANELVAQVSAPTKEEEVAPPAAEAAAVPGVEGAPAAAPAAGEGAVAPAKGAAQAKAAAPAAAAEKPTKEAKK